ncbi:MAG: FtsX-like permease family protein [Alphaproteobacteria bacterium]|nr:FtsX-like permease family protein [Alphaproteobacteria bacterium]
MFKIKRKLPLKQASPFFLTWITMLMTFVAALTLFASMSLNNIISHWNNVVSGSLTIQQPTYDLNGLNRQDEALKELDVLQEFLKNQSFVESVHILNDDEMEKLMSPWLENLKVLNELPIPKLIDVTLKKNASFSLDSFKTDVNALAPYAQVDSHRIWLSHLIDLSSGIQKTIFIIILLLALTTAFTVIYTTRSSLLVQENTLELLQLMGAKDWSIAFGVASNSFTRGLCGAAIGLILSLPIVGVVITLVGSTPDSLFLQGALSTKQWSVIIALPLIVAALSFITALITGIRKLRTF